MKLCPNWLRLQVGEGSVHVWTEREMWLLPWASHGFSISCRHGHHPGFLNQFMGKVIDRQKGKKKRKRSYRSSCMILASFHSLLLLRRGGEISKHELGVLILDLSLVVSTYSGRRSLKSWSACFLVNSLIHVLYGFLSPKRETDVSRCWNRKLEEDWITWIEWNADSCLRVVVQCYSITRRGTRFCMIWVVLMAPSSTNCRCAFHQIFVVLCNCPRQENVFFVVGTRRPLQFKRKHSGSLSLRGTGFRTSFAMSIDLHSWALKSALQV